MNNTSFGLLVSFRVPDFDLSASEVISAFNTALIDEKYIPTERMPRKAFQKALKESIQGEEGFMIRAVEKKGKNMTSGLVKEQKDANQKDLKYDVCNVLTLNSELEAIEGKCDFRTEAIVESYKTYREMLGAPEVLLKVKEILFVSMAIDMLCGKCVFIPNKFKPNVDKVVALFNTLRSVGATGIEIETVAVDSGSETKNTIVKQFLSQTFASLNKEIEFCEKQRQKLESGKIKYLRPTAFKKQLEKVKVLRERIQTYIVLLNLTPEEDKPISDKFLELDSEISKNIELAQAYTKRNKKSNKQIVAEM